jgi:hypothetical protein
MIKLLEATLLNVRCCLAATTNHYKTPQQSFRCSWEKLGLGETLFQESIKKACYSHSTKILVFAIQTRERS